MSSSWNAARSSLPTLSEITNTPFGREHAGHLGEQLVLELGRRDVVQHRERDRAGEAVVVEWQAVASALTTSTFVPAIRSASFAASSRSISTAVSCSTVQAERIGRESRTGPDLDRRPRRARPRPGPTA